MKRKMKPNDNFETKCWHNDIIADPYQVIAELFFLSRALTLKTFIGEVLECCISNTIYKRKVPADVLLYHRAIHSVITAASYLKAVHKRSIKVEDGDLLNDKYFVSARLLHNVWTDFPRFLSKKEFCNPYLVFRYFFKHNTLYGWQSDWKNIIDGALCPEEARLFINEMTVYTQLVKLIEAAHLIDVRETGPVDSNFKSRIR